MQQLELIDIENPCINVCQSDGRGYCLGCFRSRKERFEWTSMNQPQKRRTIELCRDRKKRKSAKHRRQHQAEQQATVTTAHVPPLTKHVATANQPNIELEKNDSSHHNTITDDDHSIKDMGLDLFEL